MSQVTGSRSMAQDELVLTGEAVALELPVASVGIRAVSGFLDVVLSMVLVVGGILAIAAVSPLLDEALLAAATIMLTAGVLVGLPAATETFARGRTVGKLVTGLRTVRRDGGAITFRHAFIRALIGVVEIYLLSGVPALFSAIFFPRGQRIGDLVAGTYVVRDRFGLALPPPLTCPPPLLAWAHTADLADPPVGLSVAVRSFLRRAPSMEPHARQAVAERLATSLLTYAAPAPPRGTPAEAFLAAFVARRRDRDRDRLAAEVARRRTLTSSGDA